MLLETSWEGLHEGVPIVIAEESGMFTCMLSLPQWRCYRNFAPLLSHTNWPAVVLYARKGLYWNIGMTCFPMKCFSLSLKLLSFPPLGVLILGRPNRRKWRHTACTDQHAGQNQTTFEARGQILRCRWLLYGQPSKYKSFLFDCKPCDVTRSLSHPVSITTFFCRKWQCFGPEKYIKG